MCLSDGVYPVHLQCGVVSFFPLQREDHFSQGVSDASPLQNYTWQRVQRAKFLQNILLREINVKSYEAKIMIYSFII